MPSLAPTRTLPAPLVPAWLPAAGTALVGALLTAAAIRHFGFGSPTTPMTTIWLPVHLASVVPSVPLGLWILLAPKGDARHRLLGRVWSTLMLLAALSSFGLTGLTGHLGPIHILSVLVLIGVPRAIFLARRGHIAGHRRTMTIMFLSTVTAGLFAFVPGRMLGLWLFG